MSRQPHNNPLQRTGAHKVLGRGRVMLTKEQAAAMADAITAPADAKRKTEAESRLSLKMRWIPELISVPAEDRVTMLGVAQNYAATRWPLYLPLFLAVAWAMYPIYGAEWLGLPAVPKYPPWVMPVAIAITIGLQRRFTRRYVRGALRSASDSGVDPATPPSA